MQKKRHLQRNKPVETSASPAATTRSIAPAGPALGVCLSAGPLTAICPPQGRVGPFGRGRPKGCNAQALHS